VLLKGVETIKDYAIFILDTKGHILTWNSGAEAIKGYKAEEIVGQSFSKFYEPQLVEAHYPEYELKTAIERGRFEDEGWRIRKDGTKFWANVVITAIYDEKNEPMGFVKVTRNLTERKQAERALAASERNYRTLASMAPVGILDFTPEGHLTYANEHACQVMGLTLEEALGKGWLIAIHPDDREAVMNKWYEALGYGKAFTLEYRFYHPKNDKTLWIINQAAPKLDKEGRVKSYIQTVTDITDGKRLEEAETNQKRLKEFIDTICHEIRNPLNGMAGSTQMLKETLDQLKSLLKSHDKILSLEVADDFIHAFEALNDIYQGLSQSVQQQKIVVDDVLDVSQIEHH
jgi:PAS domain S-box-containing protein